MSERQNSLGPSKKPVSLPFVYRSVTWCNLGFQEDSGVEVGIRRLGDEGISKARDPNTVVVRDLIWVRVPVEKCEIIAS